MPKVVDVEERRQHLAAAAARVIARSGVGAATVREVAAEAGLTTGALTHYFTDKRELLLLTLRASLERRRLDAPLPDTDPCTRLRALLARALPTTPDARLHWLVTLAFCAEAAGDPSLAGVQRDAYRGFRAEVVGLLEAAGAAGRLVPGLDPAATADHLIAVTDGVALQALFDPEAWPPARQRDRVGSAVSLIELGEAGEG